MSSTVEAIRKLVSEGKTRVSQHGIQELTDDAIDLRAVIAGVATSKIVEDYPNYAKGPCVLCLQRDETANPIHVLWGLAANNRNVATVITAYRPDPDRWMDDLITRRPK